MAESAMSIVKAALRESAEAALNLEGLAGDVLEASRMLVACIKSGNKVIFCGNGGSAADSQHLACELVEKYSEKRKALPAMALTTDTSILTAVPNDENFGMLFSRQIEALGKKGDVLVALSTSGKSPNVLRGLDQARSMHIRTIGLTGEDGGKMAGRCDLLIKAPSSTVARIQECHITLGHAIVQVVESELL